MKNSKLICDVVCIDKDKISQVRSRLSKPEKMQKEASLHKILGHSVRLTILEVLDQEECCVCDLASILNKPVSTVSQHLKLLKQAGFLTSRQEGKLVFYQKTDYERPNLTLNSLNYRMG